jgi:hypothetical protein
MVFGWPIAFAVALDLEPDAAMLGRVRVSAGSELIALQILFDRPLEHSTMPLAWGDFGRVRRSSISSAAQSRSNSCSPVADRGVD